MKRFTLATLLAFFLMCGFSSAIGGQVIFEWDPNSESDLAGYRMYQTTTPGQYVYGEENAIGDISAGTETFTLQIQEDGTFYWVATAYDTAGNESGPSNEVSADVNFKPPAPPTGCTLRVVK